MTKKLLAIAIAMSLMLGASGVAQAYILIYGSEERTTIEGVTFNSTTTGATRQDNDKTVPTGTGDKSPITTGANFTVTSGTWACAYGGYSKPTTGGVEVTDNQVTIQNATFNNYIFGGRVDATSATADVTVKNNTVNINDGTSATNNVYGGYATGGSTIATYVTNNVVNITGGTVEAGRLMVYGGYAQCGDATDNKVNISGGTVKVSSVYGAYTVNSGDATDNKVNISGGTVTSTVYGGYANAASSESNAIENKVNITGGTVTGTVYGGNVAKNGGKAENNKVNISGATVGGASKSVYGGCVAGGSGAATGNEVNISDGATVTCSGANTGVYGGKTAGGKAENNKVNITGGTVTCSGENSDGVFGGYAASPGDATDNVVNITGGTVDVDAGIGIVGGYSKNGNATGNTVNISGGTVKGCVYAGKADNGEAHNNTVNISGKSDLTEATLTGYNSDTKPHSGNTLNIAADWAGSVIGITNFDSVVNNGNLTVTETSFGAITDFINNNTYQGIFSNSSYYLTENFINNGTWYPTFKSDATSTNTVTKSITLNASGVINMNNYGWDGTTERDSRTLTLKGTNFTSNGGAFVINTNLANSQGDMIDLSALTGTIAGNAKVQIAYDPCFKTAASVAGNAVFLKGNGNTTLSVTGAGTSYKGVLYTPEFAKDGNNWKITAITTGATETTKSVSDTTSMMNFAWVNTINNLQKRMGDLRGGEASDMAWARFQRNNDDVNVGDKHNLSGNLYQIGYDFLIKSNDVAKNYFGLSFDVFDGTQSYKIGGGDAKSMTLSAYYTKVYESGHYFDFIFRYGRFESDTTSYDSSLLTPELTKLDYAMNGVTLSGEYGYRWGLSKSGLYLEPQAEFIYGYMSGAKTTSSTGLIADIDSTNHFVGRLGLAFGQRVKCFNYYLRGSYYHDFAGTSHIKYGDANYKQDGAENWWEVTLGGGWNLSKVSYFYAELTKHFKDISNSLNFNLGFRFTM